MNLMVGVQNVMRHGSYRRLALAILAISLCSNAVYTNGFAFVTLPKLVNNTDACM